MKFTLITPAGKIMQFYLRPVAELYQTIYGGQLIDDSILENTPKNTIAVV